MADLCDPRIRETLEVIESRLAEPLQIAMLAAAVSLSVSRFTHLFTSSTGVSPLRHLRLRRLERARQLLERTAVSIEHIRASVGYTDPSHFSKDFRRHFGVGPREYRRDYRRGLKKG